MAEPPSCSASPARGRDPRARCPGPGGAEPPAKGRRMMAAPAPGVRGPAPCVADVALGPAMPSAASRSSTPGPHGGQHRPAPGRWRRALRGCAARRPTRSPAAARPRAEPRSRPGVGVRGDATLARAAAAAAGAWSPVRGSPGDEHERREPAPRSRSGGWSGRRDTNPRRALRCTITSSAGREPSTMGDGRPASGITPRTGSSTMWRAARSRSTTRRRVIRRCSG